MDELPPPPGTGLTDADRRAIESAVRLFEEMLPAVQRINMWTDELAKRVNPDEVDRILRDKVGTIIWQAEFIERVLKGSIPHAAILDCLHYMRATGDEHVEFRELDAEQAKRLGYL